MSVCACVCVCVCVCPTTTPTDRVSFCAGLPCSLARSSIQSLLSAFFFFSFLEDLGEETRWLATSTESGVAFFFEAEEPLAAWMLVMSLARRAYLRCSAENPNSKAGQFGSTQKILCDFFFHHWAASLALFLVSERHSSKEREGGGMRAESCTKATYSSKSSIRRREASSFRADSGKGSMRRHRITMRMCRTPCVGDQSCFSVFTQTSPPLLTLGWKI